MDKAAPRNDSALPGLPIGSRVPGLSGLVLSLDRHASVSDQVHAVLRKAILDVRLAPNESISENSICKQFSVSRSPVRTAIQRLAEEGLVEVSPQRGSFVSPLRLDGLRDSHFVRRSLELALLRLTAQNWTPEMSKILREVIARQEHHVQVENPDGFFLEDERFHQVLVDFSGRPGVWAAIQAAKIPLTRFHRYWAHRSRLNDVIREHRAVVDALDSRDFEAAETALGQHLDMVFVIFDGMSAEEQVRLPITVTSRDTP